MLLINPGHIDRTIVHNGVSRDIFPRCQCILSAREFWSSKCQNADHIVTAIPARSNHLAIAIRVHAAAAWQFAHHAAVGAFSRWRGLVEIGFINALRRAPARTSTPACRANRCSTPRALVRVRVARAHLPAGRFTVAVTGTPGVARPVNSCNFTQRFRASKKHSVTSPTGLFTTQRSVANWFAGVGVCGRYEIIVGVFVQCWTEMQRRNSRSVWLC